MSRFLIAAFTIFSMGAATLAVADDRFPPIANETLRSECGECHIAYQPQMLPQRSWRKLIDALPGHFEEELSLDDEAKQQVLRYLLDTRRSNRCCVTCSTTLLTRVGRRRRGSSSAGSVPATLRFGSPRRRAGRTNTTSCRRPSGRIRGSPPRVTARSATPKQRAASTMTMRASGCRVRTKAGVAGRTTDGRSNGQRASRPHLIEIDLNSTRV